jgi:hypothetical protein
MPLALVLHAGVARATNDVARARDVSARAIAAFTRADMPMHAACAQLVFGHGEGEHWLDQMGVADPARFAAAVTGVLSPAGAPASA